MHLFLLAKVCKMPRRGMKLTGGEKKSETRLSFPTLTVLVSKLTVVKFILTKDIWLCLTVKQNHTFATNFQ